jgi:hypothetical protein
VTSDTVQGCVKSVNRPAEAQPARRVLLAVAGSSRDLVDCLSALRAVRATLPEAKFTLLASSRSMAEVEWSSFADDFVSQTEPSSGPGRSLGGTLAWTVSSSPLATQGFPIRRWAERERKRSSPMPASQPPR